jgi:long-chain acyl-CoA synthetase
VRGGNVMRGYWNQPEETPKRRNGWLLTGDIVIRTPMDTFSLPTAKRTCSWSMASMCIPAKSRKSYRHPGVKEAGRDRNARSAEGRAAHRVFAAKDGESLDERSILQHVRDNLADYKVPKRIVFLPSLPRNATGKILKTALRQMG